LTGQRQQLGLALLVQFAEPLLAADADVSTSSGNGNGKQGQAWQGVRQDSQFWELLRRCLCDSQPSSRKQAAYVLHLAAAQHDGESLCSQPFLLPAFPATAVIAV